MSGKGSSDRQAELCTVCCWASLNLNVLFFIVMEQLLINRDESEVINYHSLYTWDLGTVLFLQ